MQVGGMKTKSKGNRRLFSREVTKARNEEQEGKVQANACDEYAEDALELP
jgi:hypothetical protein